MQIFKQNMRTWYIKKKPHALLWEVHGLPTTVVTRVVDSGGPVTGTPSYKFLQKYVKITAINPEINKSLSFLYT